MLHVSVILSGMHHNQNTLQSNDQFSPYTDRTQAICRLPHVPDRIRPQTEPPEIRGG
jgi:hypothetical protein